MQLTVRDRAIWSARAYVRSRVDQRWFSKPAAMLAFCMQSQQNGIMSASITIRDVPDKTRNELAARAALSGRSLQEYLRAQLIELASRPDADTMVSRIRERKQRTGSKLPAHRILAHRNADRR
jgi:plasmid stability protein